MSYQYSPEPLGMLLSVRVLKVDTASSLERASCLMRVWDRFTGSTAGKQDTNSVSHCSPQLCTLISNAACTSSMHHKVVVALSTLAIVAHS